MREVVVRGNVKEEQGQQKRMEMVSVPNEAVDKILQHLTLQELRDEIEHSFRLRLALQVSRNSINNVASKAKIDQIITYNWQRS